jgi:predicted MFS family arabinose efflux permease
MIVARLGLMATPWIGALVVLGALALTTLAGWLDKRDGAGNGAQEELKLAA